MRILSVDDDGAIQALLREGLKSQGFDVVCVSTGAEGISRAQCGGIDCIILDNMLPDIRGPTVCRALREAGVKTPIIGLSVYIEPNQKAIMLEAGADDYLAKPFSFVEIIARIRAVTRRSQPAQYDSVITVGMCAIDTDSGLVSCGDTSSAYLTRKELGILEILAKRRGELVTRAALIEHVWDMNKEPSSNTLEQHIRSLRKKIGAVNEQYIKTVPTRGYVLET